jgi:uncharacterized protein YbjT (DUF2867 family)
MQSADSMDQMTRILVTGATGNVGGYVVSELLKAGAPVRAICRKPDAARLPSEVEVVAGDLTQPATLDAGLEGVDAVFLVWTTAPDAVPAVIDRIAKHVRRIVFLSSPYQTPHPLFQAAQPNPMSTMHANIERHIRESGMTWTFLRPGMFAANSGPWWGAQIRKGDVVRWPYAKAATAPIHTRDIAAVAARALCGTPCDGAEYVLTGPESLTHEEQVRTIGRVLGRELRFEEITPEEWVNELPPFIPARLAGMLLAPWAASVGQPALVTSGVADVTGVPARSFGEWITDNLADFRREGATKA